jgi:hypothetical protein
VDRCRSQVFAFDFLVGDCKVCELLNALTVLCINLLVPAWVVNVVGGTRVAERTEFPATRTALLGNLATACTVFQVNVYSVHNVFKPWTLRIGKLRAA